MPRQDATLGCQTTIFVTKCILFTDYNPFACIYVHLIMVLQQLKYNVYNNISMIIRILFQMNNYLLNVNVHSLIWQCFAFTFTLRLVIKYNSSSPLWYIYILYIMHWSHWLWSYQWFWVLFMQCDILSMGSIFD